MYLKLHLLDLSEASALKIILQIVAAILCVAALHIQKCGDEL